MSVFQQCHNKLLTSCFWISRTHTHASRTRHSYRQLVFILLQVGRLQQFTITFVWHDSISPPSYRIRSDLWIWGSFLETKLNATVGISGPITLVSLVPIRKIWPNKWVGQSAVGSKSLLVQAHACVCVCVSVSNQLLPHFCCVLCQPFLLFPTVPSNLSIWSSPTHFCPLVAQLLLVLYIQASFHEWNLVSFWYDCELQTRPSL